MTYQAVFQITKQAACLGTEVERNELFIVVTPASGSFSHDDLRQTDGLADGQAGRQQTHQSFSRD